MLTCWPLKASTWPVPDAPPSGANSRELVVEADVADDDASDGFRRQRLANGYLRPAVVVPFVTMMLSMDAALSRVVREEDPMLVVVHVSVAQESGCSRDDLVDPHVGVHAPAPLGAKLLQGESRGKKALRHFVADFVEPTLIIDAAAIAHLQISRDGGPFMASRVALVRLVASARMSPQLVGREVEHLLAELLHRVRARDLDEAVVFDEQVGDGVLPGPCSPGYPYDVHAPVAFFASRARRASEVRLVKWMPQ